MKVHAGEKKRSNELTPGSAPEPQPKKLRNESWAGVTCYLEICVPGCIPKKLPEISRISFLKDAGAGRPFLTGEIEVS